MAACNYVACIILWILVAFKYKTRGKREDKIPVKGAVPLLLFNIWEYAN